jgi:hypothetical protein
MRLLAEIDAAAVELSIRHPSVAETELALAMSSLALAHEKFQLMATTSPSSHRRVCGLAHVLVEKADRAFTYTDRTTGTLTMQVVGKGVQRGFIDVRYRY